SIKVIFPNAGMREGLKVFQGVNQDGGIRWRESGELENIAALDSLAIGQQLYDFHCSSCHSTDLKTDATGPALGNVHLFRKKDWFRDFTRNSQKMIAEKDSLAVCIWQQWKPTVMPRYDYLRDADDPEDRDYTPPILTDNQIDLIYDYLANESILRKIEIDEVSYITECVFDTISLVENVESFIVDTINLGFSDAIPTVSNIFRINRLAWANIDRFWNDPRTRSKKFFIRAKSIDTIEYYNISIVFRMQNVYIPSFWNENNLYSFTHNKYEEYTTFPIGEPAILIATAQEGNQFFFGYKEITYGDNEIEEIELKVSSEEEIEEIIRRIL
ncbi:MAG: cytochrome c, partial [Bacteroidota bacterium]